MKPAVVLVPLDGSKEASVALIPARRAALNLDATVVLLHVESVPISPDSLKERLGLTDEEVRGCLMESMVAASPAAGIIRRAADPIVKLIVMSTYVSEAGLNSVTADVIRSATCPVLAVHPGLASRWVGERPSSLRILVPHDASPAAANAMEWAARLAQREEGTLEVLHVAMTGVTPPSLPGSLPLGPYCDDIKEWSQEFVERFCMPYCGPRGVHPTVHVRRGALGPEIVRFAEENGHDLIVVAWSGGSDTEHGGVIRTLLARTPCPLLFVSQTPQDLVFRETSAERAMADHA